MSCLLIFSASGLDRFKAHKPPREKFFVLVHLTPNDLFYIIQVSMKKVFIIICGIVAQSVVWAQQVTPTNISGKNISVFLFNAFGAKSIDNRFSSGIFLNDIDHFANLSDWRMLDSDGAFLFLGAAQSDPAKNKTLQGGFSKTFANNYFAAYLSGAPFTGGGKTYYDENDNKHVEDSFKRAYIDFVFLWGSEKLGALRFDLITNGTSSEWTENDALDTSSQKTGAFVTALSWGKNFDASVGVFKPTAALAARLPAVNKQTDANGTTTTVSDLAFAAKFAAAYDFLSGGSLGGDVTFSYAFGESYENDADKTRSFQESGVFTAPLNIYYQSSLALGNKVTVGFKPNLKLALEVKGQETRKSPNDLDYGTVTYLQALPAVDIGLRFEPFKKLALFSGANITLCNFEAAFKSEGNSAVDADKRAKASAWSLSALALSGANDVTSLGAIGAGLVWTPVENLSLGIDLNWLITFDTKNYALKFIKFWEESENTFLKLNITLTYKYKKQEKTI